MFPYCNEVLLGPMGEGLWSFGIKIFGTSFPGFLPFFPPADFLQDSAYWSFARLSCKTIWNNLARIFLHSETLEK